MWNPESLRIRICLGLEGLSTQMYVSRECVKYASASEHVHVFGTSGLLLDRCAHVRFSGSVCAWMCSSEHMQLPWWVEDMLRMHPCAPELVWKCLNRQTPVSPHLGVEP